MLHEDKQSVEAETSAAHAAAYCDALGAIVANLGVDAVAAEIGIDEATLQRLADEDSSVADELTLENAAAIQALDTDLAAETIHAEACDRLLLGMSMAVLDVDTIAAEYDGELSGKGIQQRLERRAPTTLAEFARIEYFVTSRR